MTIPKVESPEPRPVERIAPPQDPLREVFPEQIIHAWMQARNPSDQLMLRWQILEADGSYPIEMRGLRAYKAAWETYLYSAFACQMFRGERGADLRARLTGSNDANFRSAMSECLSCWLFAGPLGMPINPVAAGRGRKNLEMLAFDNDRVIAVEVKAPYRPFRESGWGDDSDAIESVLKQADKQFDKTRPNVLVVTPQGRLRMCSHRKPLMRALYGTSKVTVNFDKKTGAAVGEPKVQFFPDGKFFENKLPSGRLIKPPEGSPAFQRVSALLCIEERIAESDPGCHWLSPIDREGRLEATRRRAKNRTWIDHDVVVLHNPFAYHPIGSDLFSQFAQCLPAGSGMMWTDGYSTEV